MKMIVVCWLFVSNHSTSKEPLNKERKYAHLLQFQISAEHISRDKSNPSGRRYGWPVQYRETPASKKAWKKRTGWDLQIHCLMGSSITERAAFLIEKLLIVHGTEITVFQAKNQLFQTLKFVSLKMRWDYKHHAVEFHIQSERRREPNLPRSAVGWLECQAEGCRQPECCSGLDTHVGRTLPYADPWAAILFDDGIMAVKDKAMIWYWCECEEQAEHFSL